MAGEKFTIETNKALDSSAITENGRHQLYTSPSVSNASGNSGYLYDSLRLVIDYENLNPDLRTEFDIQAIVESSNGEDGADQRWFPVAYQFEPFYRSDFGPKREILLQPNLIVIDVGIDDIVYVGGFEAAVSRQQGKLGSDFRVVLILNERGFGTPEAFSGVDVSIYGEMFSAND